MIYLDYNATTPIADEVREHMLPYLSDYFGNPSSIHFVGRKAKKAMDDARKQVALTLNCDTEEVYFTSGGTESNNWAIKGVALANRHKGNHIVTSSVEHPAVLKVCDYLEKEFGFRITKLPVDRVGRVRCEELSEALSPDTVLVTIMHANNEVGTLQPISDISIVCRERGIYLHTDASQSVGKVSTDVRELGVDLLTIAAHKLYGPKGVLYVKRGTVMEKFMHGAGHESDRRAGTENVLFMAGLGKACEIARRDLEENIRHCRKNRDLLLDLFRQRFEVFEDAESAMSSPKSDRIQVLINGDLQLGLPNTLSASFRGIIANQILHRLSEQLAASAGSACHSDVITISSVLEAMAVPHEFAMGTIRFSTGRMTTEPELHLAVELLETTLLDVTRSDLH
ncbi:Selenide, water dikinase [Planoprotostelium fungivorum]|uniref:Selenide, water dikinase n=1 Tax=Planoprotostelium fungivorum TaxID=1890364 RepID=A0A2P6MWC0_9EUKA|nr:Selenide, water dikinase [Planoprotostelium fungivorum]